MSKAHNRQRYKAFSKLMSEYRARKNLSITGLHALLQGRCGYAAHRDTIRRYDRGERHPDELFVVLIRKCLDLNQLEFENLIDAIIIDFNEVTFDTYRSIAISLIAKKSPCAPDSDFG